VLSAKRNGETILLHQPQWNDQESALRAFSKEGHLIAPCCGARLILKWGRQKVRHFAHAPKTNCPYERWTEPESPEHLAGKALLFDWCQRVFATTARLIALEHPLPETLQRPDVYVELADGTRYALEYQRSVLSPGEWEERHEGYRRLGIEDIWIFGENRLSDALPTAEQQARWSLKEPHMHFLKPRAFESLAAVRTPYEVAWWRGDHQAELWETLELDARVGREINPWYKRSALQRLRSISYLHAETGELWIYRAMRDLRGHTETKMASVLLKSSLSDPDLRLEPTGFSLPQDQKRLAGHLARVARLEASAGAHPIPDQPPQMAPSPEVPPLPAHMPYAWHEAARQRKARQWPIDLDGRPFQPGEQEEEQRRRLVERMTNPHWRRIVDRYGLNPENLHFLIGVPILDDTCIAVHRTVWQAFIYYRLVYQQRRSLSTADVARLLERTFGFDAELTRGARFFFQGDVNAPEDAVGRFLLLLAEAGYLRSDRQSEHFRFYIPEDPPPPLAFRDRTKRWTAWNGLLSRELRRDGNRLIGPEASIELAPAVMADRATPAQVDAVARLAQRRGWDLDPAQITYTEASRILSEARHGPRR